MKSNRKKERELVVLSLYSIEITNNDIESTIDYIVKENKIEDVTDYVLKNVSGVMAHKEKIDEIIKRNLAKYTIDRLSLVDLQIIRFSTYELFYMHDEVASAVSINEAVELAKKYSDLEDTKPSSFVNSVLDKIMKDVKI